MIVIEPNNGFNQETIVGILQQGTQYRCHEPVVIKSLLLDENINMFLTSNVEYFHFGIRGVGEVFLYPTFLVYNNHYEYATHKVVVIELPKNLSFYGIIRFVEGLGDGEFYKNILTCSMDLCGVRATCLKNVLCYGTFKDGIHTDNKDLFTHGDLVVRGVGNDPQVLTPNHMVYSVDKYGKVTVLVNGYFTIEFINVVELQKYLRTGVGFDLLIELTY